MKQLLNQSSRQSYDHFYRWWKLPSPPPAVALLWPILALPGYPAQEEAWWLFLIMILIGLLFVAVAIILPIALHFTRPHAKKNVPIPAETPATAPEDRDTVPFVVDPLPLTSSAVAPDEMKTLPSVVTKDDDTKPYPPANDFVKEPETAPIGGQRPAGIGWQIAGLSDVGLKRELNEDNLLMVEADTPCGLYVVADGLGGHDAGEVASRLTIDTIRQQFIQHPPLIEASQTFGDWLQAATKAANQVVLARQGDRTEDRKMGSTLIMALVTEGQAHIANVGDSRAYHLNDAGIRQISVDHSLVERLVQIGQLTREEARTHKQKNVIYNTIGDKPNIDISLYQVDLQLGDRLLLCSDGLSGMLTDDELLEISRAQPDPTAACKAMVAAAKSAGGHDNITAIVVQMNK